MLRRRTFQAYLGPLEGNRRAEEAGFYEQLSYMSGVLAINPGFVLYVQFTTGDENRS